MAQLQQFSNNASAFISGTLTNSATTINLVSGAGVAFPAVSSPNYFVATLKNTVSGVLEIVQVTNRTGDILTVVRGYESTTAATFNDPTILELRPTAGAFNTVYNEIATKPDNPMTTVGDIIQGGTAGAQTRLAAVASGNALLSGGVGTANSWGKIGLTTHVSGTLPIANGGTNATTATNARTQLGAAGSGAVGSSGLTMTTSRLLGRSTAATGAIEEITLGTGLAFSGTTLNATASGAGTIVAWVNFNGTGTVAIRASGNVSSITDNGTGDYTVNFTSALADANYAILATGNGILGTQSDACMSLRSNPPTTTAARVFATLNPATGAAVDASYVSVTFVR